MSLESRFSDLFIQESDVGGGQPDPRAIIPNPVDRAVTAPFEDDAIELEPATPRLTTREIEMHGFLQQGLSNAEIARLLWVTEQTVKFHLSNLYQKLGVDSREEAALISLPDREITEDSIQEANNPVPAEQDQGKGFEEAHETTPNADLGESQPLSFLNMRERQILQLASEGLSDPEIGRQLFLSDDTVTRHMRSAFKKLDVENREAAIHLVPKPQLSDLALNFLRRKVEKLTPRHKDFLRLLGEDKTKAEIAAELAIKPSTIDVYISKMRDTLGIANYFEVLWVARALAAGRSNEKSPQE